VGKMINVLERDPDRLVEDVSGVKGMAERRVADVSGVKGMGVNGMGGMLEDVRRGRVREVIGGARVVGDGDEGGQVSMADVHLSLVLRRLWRR
jgi:hypothetical protein